LPCLTLIAVLPPTDESTCANKEVGIWIYSIPLRYVAAQNPVISPTTPPPKAINLSERSNFKSNSLFNIFWYEEKDFDFSPWLNVITFTFLFLIIFF